MYKFIAPPAEYHIKFGKHSNIPDCCIQYFISSKYQYLYTANNWKYIPCPKCFKENKKNKLHYCNYKCIPFLLEIDNAAFAGILEREHKKKLKKRRQIYAQNSFKAK